MRQPSASDRRYITLRLSEQGERIQTEARAAALKRLAERLEPLDAAQRDSIVQALGPLRQVFASQSADAADAADHQDGATPSA